jgi:hypothetical protein
VKDNHALSAQNPGKVCPATPDQEKCENAAKDREGKTFRRHEGVKENDVHNDRAEDNEAERDPTEEDESAAQDLEKEDDAKISGAGKSGAELFGGLARRWRHVDEMEESIQPEDDEGQPEQNARDDGDNFHEREPAPVARQIQ